MSITRRRFIKSTVALTGSTLTGLGRDGVAVSSQSSDSEAPSRRRSGQRPNVVIAVLDDVGFGDLGCFGSEIPTTCIDGLATNGLRYNNFHVTSLCAPTRACLLTGVNAHAAGVGNIAEWGREHSGYRGWIRDDVKTLAEYLGPAGYSTYAVGKWHLSTVEGRNATGPFDQWPTGRGFDHWYGFHGAAVDHWHPELFRNRTAIYPDKSSDYHLTEDLVDRSIAYIKDHEVASPDRPFLMYLAFGACHYPYHVPEQYMQEHRGRYGVGWDKIREQRFARQREIGIVPKHASLSPRNDGVPAWEDISDGERRFSARTQEAYAGFLHHTDDQLQRLVDYLEYSGQIENTILIVLSDNGAGSWAPPMGRLDVHRVVYIEPEKTDEVLASIDLVGTEQSQPSYSPDWAQVSNTPLKYYKADTFEGGIRAPFIVHWPGGNLPKKDIRRQYHHVTDIVPTVLELIDLPQESLDGISMAYTFDRADEATRKSLQYYETAGDRAIWTDGWKAVTQHQSDSRFEDDHWSLYHASEDFTEVNDLSEAHPDRLREMKALWFKEAERNNVLPLEDDLMSLEHNLEKQTRSRYLFYPGSTRIDKRSAPDIFAHDYEIVAEVVLQDEHASGVVLASGDSMAGYELLLRDGWLEYTYIYTRNERYFVKADSRVADGQHVLCLRGQKTGEKSGRVELLIDGEVVGTTVVHNMWKVKSLNAGVRCGENRGAPISLSYKGTFKFDQTLERVTVSLSS